MTLITVLIMTHNKTSCDRIRSQEVQREDYLKIKTEVPLAYSTNWPLSGVHILQLVLPITIFSSKQKWSFCILQVVY